MIIRMIRKITKTIMKLNTKVQAVDVNGLYHPGKVVGVNEEGELCIRWNGYSALYDSFVQKKFAREPEVARLSATNAKRHSLKHACRGDNLHYDQQPLQTVVIKINDPIRCEVMHHTVNP